MNQSLTQPIAVTSSACDWMHDRLTEARGILADVPRHTETLVILACRVVAEQTNDASECADAVELLRQLDRRPLHFIAAAAAFPNGGAV